MSTTNFEDIIKADIDSVKDLVARFGTIRNKDSKLVCCNDIQCTECKFHNFKPCKPQIREWFDREHQ